MPVPSAIFEQLLPLAAAWAAEQEAVILARGTALTLAQISATRISGVTHPEKVRILCVDSVPAPADPILVEAAKLAGLVTSDSAGLTLGHGIFIRSEYLEDHSLLVHEMAHVAQYERLGGIEPFLRQYLWECITVGYAGAPLEQEAVRIAASAPV